MKTNSFLFTASAALAMALTFSCSNDKDDDKLKRQGKAKEYFFDERDGKRYEYVTIGAQTWMAENLNYAAEGSKCGVLFTDPDSLEYAAYETDVCQGNNNGTCTVSGVLSKDNTDICDKYGRLYNWETAMDSIDIILEDLVQRSYEGVQGVCPAGWHIPTYEEWNALYFYGDDDYGFNALYGGTGTKKNGFANFGIRGTFHTATIYGASLTSHRIIENSVYQWGRGEASLLHSVRCIKDGSSSGSDNMCGAVPYDAVSGNFRCENGFVETKCGENWYDHLNPMFRCENNIVEAKCGDGWYNYSAKKEYCSKGTKKTYGSVTDKGGNIYKTVEIGAQTWMAENLNLAISNRGYTGNSKANSIYGRLYNWTTTMDIDEKCYGHLYNCTQYTSTDPAVISRDSLCTACTSQIKPEKHQGICPEGWHVPSIAEWDVLIEYAQKDNNEDYNKYNKPGDYDHTQHTASVAGKHLKSMSVWERNSGSSGIDTYGFEAIPGGYANIPSTNATLSGRQGYWWSTRYEQTAWNAPGLAYYWTMRYDSNNASLEAFDMRNYYSIRCLKN